MAKDRNRRDRPIIRTKSGPIRSPQSTRMRKKKGSKKKAETTDIESLFHHGRTVIGCERQRSSSGQP
jgi:hypothetical protein